MIRIHNHESLLEAGLCRCLWLAVHMCTCLCWRILPFHFVCCQTGLWQHNRQRHDVVWHYEPFLQPPGGTGRTQNQGNHGNNWDALERGAIAEIRIADTCCRIDAIHCVSLALVFLRAIRKAKSLYDLMAWNTAERYREKRTVVQVNIIYTYTYIIFQIRLQRKKSVLCTCLTFAFTATNTFM